MSANYTPNQNEYKNLTPFKCWLLHQINNWGLNNFPFVESDFDELTNYGMLMKMMKALNDVISNQNDVEQDMTNLFNAFTELQTYVNDYFDNLDVQDEINNKLDEMAEDGSLMELLSSYLPYVTPEMFGAKGDGETDDTIAIQSAIDSANTNKTILYLLNKTYITTDSLKIYSRLEIQGNNATIKNETNNPIITSDSIVNNINIHDLTLIGADNEEFSNNTGIDLICYYSKFRNLYIAYCYSGIYIHSDGASGTLVENRFENIRCSNYYLYGIFIGVNGNNKLTDGFLNNIICNANTNTTQNAYGLYIGSSAGYNINGVHIYGKHHTAMSIANAYYTNVANIYIESFTNYGLTMGSTQMGANVSNVQINHANTTNTGTAIRIEVAQYLPYNTHAGNLSNIRITRGSSTSGKSIVCASGIFNASNVIIDGDTRTIANDCSGINFAYNGLTENNDFVLNRQKNGAINTGIKCYTYRGFNPNSTTLEFDFPVLTYNNAQAIVELTGIGGQYTSQSGLFYKGMIQVVRVSDTNYVARIHDIENTLFTSTPSVSLDLTTHKLTLTIAIANTTYGNLYYDIYYPNK